MTKAQRHMAAVKALGCIVCRRIGLGATPADAHHIHDGRTRKGTENMNKSLVLRICGPNGESHNGFRWPLEVGAVVKAPDWRKTHECGNGLHGWLYGQGDHACTNKYTYAGAQWLVVEVDSDSIIELGGKVKFPECVVRFVGDAKSATDYLWENEPRSRDVAVIGACRAEKQGGAKVVVGALGTATAGYRGTATAGHSGTATAGHSGTATAGYRGTATAGHSGTATAGYRGTATAGPLGTATAGDSGTATAGPLGTATVGALGTATAGHSGTATAGYRGTATAGDSGTATAGHSGTATAGYRGTATAGDSGTATAGPLGTATAGKYGVIAIEYYDAKAGVYRKRIGTIGEDGLKPNVAYKLDENNRFVKAK